ncbi:uncharacterized protein LOC132642329 isoform X1 [Lycium barbarum]|uniref:uncharacterized protein LOC132642329 isoform X1 n=1 Tax=Lycium barbarum TaxID=112863 RepID=UPI00293E10EB|nr:uncharacterized protein LOC132642329 isoform X1 [Lycium barbarum]
MSSGEMSPDTNMEYSTSFDSSTHAIIHGNSDNSGRDESMISDPNIPSSNSSSDDDDLMIDVSNPNCRHKSDQQEEVRIFNVDFRALTGVSGNKYVPIADTDCRQNMLKRSIKFFRNLYRMKRQEHIRPNRPTGDGKIKSFFSNLNLMGDNNRSGQGRS